MKSVIKFFKNEIADGIVLIIIGLVLVLWSKHSLITLFQILGAGLIIMGIMKWVIYFMKKEHQKNEWAELIVGLVQIAAGILIFVRAEPLTLYFPGIAALILAYGAVMMIIRAVKMRMEPLKRFLPVLILGIVSLMLAVIIFAHPVFLQGVMIQAAGGVMIFEGLALLILTLI